MNICVQGCVVWECSYVDMGMECMVEWEWVYEYVDTRGEHVMLECGSEFCDREDRGKKREGVSVERGGRKGKECAVWER